MIAKILAVAGVAAVAVGLTACGPQQPAAAVPSAENQAAVTPSAASQPHWQSGGRFTGQWPPAESPPAQWAVKDLGTEKDSQGYDYRITAAFGPALHYGVPKRGIDCNLSQSYSIDLPPGQYEVPFRVTATNLLDQQAPWSLGPVVDAGSVQSTGTGGSALTWDDGACQENVYKNLGAGGTAVAFGVIGPATASELQQVIVTVTAEDAQLLNAPLRTLTPGRTLPGS